MAKKEEKAIQETIGEILNKLEIAGDFDFTVNENEVAVTLNTEDSGIVIGYHGEVLESLQLVLSLAISKKQGVFTRVSVEVGDYKKNRSDWLENLAIRAKEKALLQNSEVPLTNLKSWERRIVHMLLQEDTEVVSESVGEGRNRTLVIKPRV